MAGRIEDGASQSHTRRVNNDRSLPPGLLELWWPAEGVRTMWKTPPTDDESEKLTKARGAASLALLNDSANEWQKNRAPELAGHYLTAIDYVKANLVHWNTVDDLLPKIEAAAHAYKWRSRFATISSTLTILVGAALGAAMKALAKASEGDIAISLIMIVGGGAITFGTSAILKPRFVTVHADRAKRWKEQLDALTLAYEKAAERASVSKHDS